MSGTFSHFFGFPFLFQGKTHYQACSPRRWTSSFRFRYLDDSIPVRQQGIHQIPKRHPRLFQSVVSCGVFLGTMYDVWRWRHLHRVKQHKVSKIKIDLIPSKGKTLSIHKMYLASIILLFISAPFSCLLSFCGSLFVDRLVWFQFALLLLENFNIKYFQQY